MLMKNFIGGIKHEAQQLYNQPSCMTSHPRRWNNTWNNKCILKQFKQIVVINVMLDFLAKEKMYENCGHQY
jgi:hypothetical protein